MNKVFTVAFDVIAEFATAQDSFTGAALDTVDDGDRMVAAGFHVETDNQPENILHDRSFSVAELALLNMPVTDEIDAILVEMANELNSHPELVVEDEVDDNQADKLDLSDREKKLNSLIPLFDEYFRLTNLLDKGVTKFGWAQLSMAKDHAWDEFKDSMGFNYLKLDMFEDKADLRLRTLEAKGSAPTSEQWERYKAIRSKLCVEGATLQSQRVKFTYPLYQKALAMNAKCASFWKSPEGAALNEISHQRQELYDLLHEKDVDGDVPWNFIADYFRLREEEISPYFTSGDTQSVDDPEYIEIQHSTIESLTDSHLAEQFKVELGDRYWSKRCSDYIDYRLDRALSIMGGIEE